MSLLSAELLRNTAARSQKLLIKLGVPAKHYSVKTAVRKKSTRLRVMFLSSEQTDNQSYVHIGMCRCLAVAVTSANIRLNYVLALVYDGTLLSNNTVHTYFIRK